MPHPIIPCAGFPRRRQLLTYGGLAASGILTACGAPVVDPNVVLFPPTRARGDAAKREAALPPGAPMLFMVTAPDCPICLTWKAKYQPDFEASEARARSRFVILNSATLRQGSGRNNTWPAEYRWARDAAAADTRGDFLPFTRYSPLFVLVNNGKYVRAANGTKGWNATMWPAIQQETGTA